MRLLGIDSSQPNGSAALLENQSILSQKINPNPESRANPALALVDAVLSDAAVELKALDGFAITTGPGSFTGLRVGISLIKGFVLSLEKPFIGISTLEALAATVSPDAPGIICPVLDARKKEIYTALFQYQAGHLVRLTEDAVYSPEELCRIVSQPTIFLGNGLESYKNYLQDRLGPRMVSGDAFIQCCPAAGAARLAARRFAKEKSFDLNTLQINYIRKPEAEINLKT